MIRKFLMPLFIGVMSTGIASSANAKKAPMPFPIASGIYSNVTESEETGDRGGVEFRFYGNANPAYVEAVVCEAECTGEGRYYVRPAANGFTFSWKSPRYPDETPIEFVVTKKNNGYWIEGKNGQWGRSKLKLLKKPFGLLGVYKWAKP